MIHDPWWSKMIQASEVDSHHQLLWPCRWAPFLTSLCLKARTVAGGRSLFFVSCDWRFQPPPNTMSKRDFSWQKLAFVKVMETATPQPWRSSWTFWTLAHCFTQGTSCTCLGWSTFLKLPDLVCLKSWATYRMVKYGEIWWNPGKRSSQYVSSGQNPCTN